MDALVMAGGKGTRLGMGEKPLVKLLGRPLIHYVIATLENSSVDRIHIAVTKNVPKTSKWAEERGHISITTPGMGFVADMIYAAQIADFKKPILIIMADLPLITPDILDEIFEVYEHQPEPALSTHTPLQLHAKLGRQPDSLFNYDGQLIVPSGVNILDGANIKDEQEDYHLIMERIELAINVNVDRDLRLCESILLGDVY
ncbi:MAG: NTP transferase domain-containing protein [Methanotrichaceae archaeon]|nr:NTP transferase domain-containing protein [Methanotrichaceae archaeon]